MYKKINWDNLKLISMLSVITIHVSGLFLVSNSSDLNDWALVINQFSRFAVPAFFMSSGFGLIISKKNTESFLFFIKNRSIKILPTFFISSFFYFVIFNRPLSNLFTLNSVIIIISGKSYYHLYYIFVLYTFYLLFIPLAKLLNSHPKSLLFFSFSIQFFSQTLGILQIIQVSEYNLFNWFFYFILGMYIGKVKPKVIAKHRLLIVSLIFFLLSLIFSYYIFKNTENISLATTAMNPLISLFSIFFILSLLQFNMNFSLIKINSFSFLVYIVHPFYVALVSKILNVQSHKSLLYFLITLLLVTFISLVTSVLIQKSVKRG